MSGQYVPFPAEKHGAARKKLIKRESGKSCESCQIGTPGSKKHSIWLFNIAMENPRTKWWCIAGKIIYKWAINTMAMLNNWRSFCKNLIFDPMAQQNKKWSKFVTDWSPIKRFQPEAMFFSFLMVPFNWLVYSGKNTGKSHDLHGKSGWFPVEIFPWKVNQQLTHGQLIGGLNPSEKYESQLGWWHSQNMEK